ncbi:MAG: formylglycine-generating enzyme family protein [Pirellula sp.]
MIHEGSYRVNRGGSWNNEAANCRSANRNRNDPSNRNNNLGFRLALNSIGITNLPGWVVNREVPNRTDHFPAVLALAIAQNFDRNLPGVSSFCGCQLETSR